MTITNATDTVICDDCRRTVKKSLTQQRTDGRRVCVGFMARSCLAIVATRRPSAGTFRAPSEPAPTGGRAV